MLLTYSIQRIKPRDPELGKRWVQTAHNLPVETSGGLKRQNLCDHMTGLELILSMLGEADTAEITKGDNAQGLEDNKHAARKGGEVVEPLWHRTFPGP